MADRELVTIDGHYVIWLFRDSLGKTWYNVVADSSDIIQICGLSDAKGDRVYFESEAYHAPTWCEENDITYRKVENEFYETIS